jgi:predicted transcriptional regulator
VVTFALAGLAAATLLLAIERALAYRALMAEVERLRGQIRALEEGLAEAQRGGRSAAVAERPAEAARAPRAPEILEAGSERDDAGWPTHGRGGRTIH